MLVVSRSYHQGANRVNVYANKEVTITVSKIGEDGQTQEIVKRYEPGELLGTVEVSSVNGTRVRLGMDFDGWFTLLRDEVAIEDEVLEGYDPRRHTFRSGKLVR